jgi:hypothetical protein
MKKQMLRITDKSVCIYLSGRSDFYGGALVQGAFCGHEYYRRSDIDAVYPSESLRDYDTDWVRYNFRPYRVVGYVVK